MFKQQEIQLVAAFKAMSELDRQMLLYLAEARATANKINCPKLKLVPNLLPSDPGCLLRTAR